MTNGIKIVEVKVTTPPKVFEVPKFVEPSKIGEAVELFKPVPEFLTPASSSVVMDVTEPAFSSSPGLRLGGGELLIDPKFLGGEEVFSNGVLSVPSLLSSGRSFFYPSQKVLQTQAAQERFPAPSAKQVEALRGVVKEALGKNGDWVKILIRSSYLSTANGGANESFVDRLSYEQLLIFEALLKIDAPKKGETKAPGRFLWRMKESGFLDSLLKLPPESQRAFAMLATMSAEKGQGYSFAERVFFDYGRPGVLFEEVYDPATQSKRSRLELVLTAYYWMEAAGVKGGREVLNGVTSQYFDSYQNKWTDVQGPNQWRGNLDEAIRMGGRARESAWRPFHGEALSAVDGFIGNISYVTPGGGKANALLHPDGLRRDGWIEEYKSTYHEGSVAGFSFETMSNELAFRNQVIKYGQAVEQGKISGVVYRITAQSVDPGVVHFIQEHIPNVKIVRYDSITDTQGTVELDQTKKTVIPSPGEWKGAWQRAQDQGNPFFIENGVIQSYLMPKAEECTVKAGKIKQELRLYTETLLTKNHERLMDRARKQIDWLSNLYDGLDAAGRLRLEKDVAVLIQELDQATNSLLTEDAKAKFITEKIDELARWVVTRELPVLETASLGMGGAFTPLEEIPGTFKVYHKGDFGTAGPNGRLTLRKGMRIYIDSLSPREAVESFQNEAAAGKKNGSPQAPRDQVLAFESGDLKIKEDPHFKAGVDAEGRLYFEVVKDLTLTNTADQKRFEVKYFGGNPLLEIYPSENRRAGNE